MSLTSRRNFLSAIPALGVSVVSINKIKPDPTRDIVVIKVSEFTTQETRDAIKRKWKELFPEIPCVVCISTIDISTVRVK